MHLGFLDAREQRVRRSAFCATMRHADATVPAARPPPLMSDLRILLWSIPAGRSERRAVECTWLCIYDMYIQDFFSRSPNTCPTRCHTSSRPRLVYRLGYLGASPGPPLTRAGGGAGGPLRPPTSRDALHGHSRNVDRYP